ncbi:TPA: hypothetical protein ACGN81_005144 [Bacillus cereus]
MTEKHNSFRRVPKATYVPLEIPLTIFKGGGAIQKYSFVQQLRLQPGEVELARTEISTFTSDKEALWHTLAKFEGNPLPIQLPPPNVFVDTPSEDLLAFGKALSTVRQQRLNRLENLESEENPLTHVPNTNSDTMSLLPKTKDTGTARLLLNNSLVATNTFEQTFFLTSLGMLNLERLEMTPAGLQRGELIATIPLAPMEKTAVVHKEWSVTSKEFTSIVTDTLENYSETGITENTELAQSTTSQTQHSNQFNVNATISGGIGFVTGSTASGFTAQDQSSLSATDSTKHAISTTRKASSRVKQEHKVTISTTTVTGTSEESTRVLENPNQTQPMRVDYYSLMRKWHVGLYRYGLRLTYDIVIPEPGAQMRKLYAKLDDLRTLLGKPFEFPYDYNTVSFGSTTKAAMSYIDLLELASKAGIQMPPLPDGMSLLDTTIPINNVTAWDKPVQTLGGVIAGLNGKDDDTSWHFNQIGVTVPAGYKISNVTLEVMLGHVGVQRNFYVLGSGGAEDLPPNVPNKTIDLTNNNGFMEGLEGTQSITYFVQNCGEGAATFRITYQPKQEVIDQWIASVVTALNNAALTEYYATQQSLNAQIQDLEEKINSEDTLTLRREENDEIMRGVLQWLLGPHNFKFMPDDVRDIFRKGNVNPKWGTSFSASDTILSNQEWGKVSDFENLVRFINDAIDWDSTMYFLYSYFWDIPDSWDNISTIQHPDATRQAFLRAGSARVVLTVRKGWEVAWTYFAEFGSTFLPSHLPPHPYLSIAKEIQDYDNTNYPGIPPANPGMPPDDGQYVATVTNGSLTSGTSIITVASNSGFVVGYTVLIDSWTSGVQETQTIVAVSPAPDTTHITVTALKNSHDDHIPIIQQGEKGILMAEWFEYTPSSGTDIEVNSDLSSNA